MREIKFRAWHTKGNKMFSPEEMGEDQLTIMPDGRGFINVSGTSTKLSQLIPEMIPMQYTGLKDKNGKEIYEGDIVHFKTAKSLGHQHDGLDAYRVIKFGEFTVRNESLWNFIGFYAESLGGDRGSIKYTLGLGATVVGNIYENPELLNSEQSVQGSVATKADSSIEAGNKIISTEPGQGVKTAEDMLLDIMEKGKPEGATMLPVEELKKDLLFNLSIQAMEEYAEQYRNQDGWINVEELMKAYKNYIFFLENESNRYVQFAGIHGMRVRPEVFEKGQALRNEISKFEILLYNEQKPERSVATEDQSGNTKPGT